MKTFIWAVAVLCACAGLSEAAEARRSSSRSSSSKGAFSGGRSTSRRFPGARSRSSYSGGGAQTQFSAPQRSFTRMDAPTPPSTPPTPAQYGVPAPVEGATLRNLGFQQGPGGPFKEHAVEAGPIAYEDSRGQILDQTAGGRRAPPDKMPPPNPGSVTSGGGASGANAITPNSPLQGLGTTGQ